MEHSEPSRTTLFFTYASLMGLLALTAFASFLSPPWLSNTLSLLIAVAKAALILLFFMHLRYRSARHRVVALAAVLWLVFFLVITLGDYLTRGMIHVIGK